MTEAEYRELKPGSVVTFTNGTRNYFVVCREEKVLLYREAVGRGQFWVTRRVALEKMDVLKPECMCSYYDSEDPDVCCCFSGGLPQRLGD